MTLEDGTSYPIESKGLSASQLLGDGAVRRQQGAGMMILKSEEKRVCGVHFLKWFTGVDNNIRFSVSSGYLPVKKEAGVKERLETVLAENGEEDAAGENLLIGLGDCQQVSAVYDGKPFEGGDQARAILNATMADKARDDKRDRAVPHGAGKVQEEAVRAVYGRI